jgi:hypothetical protein
MESVVEALELLDKDKENQVKVRSLRACCRVSPYAEDHATHLEQTELAAQSQSRIHQSSPDPLRATVPRCALRRPLL